MRQSRREWAEVAGLAHCDLSQHAPKTAFFCMKVSSRVKTPDVSHGRAGAKLPL